MKEYIKNHKKIIVFGSIGLFIILGVAIYFLFFFCNHDYSSQKIIKEGNCTQKSVWKYTCTKCGHSYTENGIINKDNHVYETKIIKNPTCVEVGKTQYKCELCGHKYIKTEYAEHEWEIATCTTPKKCKVCGKTQGEVSTNHNYAAGTCKNCGKSQYKIVSSGGVNFKLRNDTVKISDSYNNQFVFSDLSVKLEKSSSGYSNFYVYYSGEMLGGSGSISFKYSLYDPDGYVVASGTNYTKDLEYKEKVKNDMFEIYLNHTNGSDLIAGKTYELKITP